MAAQQDKIDRALEFAAAGRSEEALRLLRPMIRDDAMRDQALFALAYCFEKADNLAPLDVERDIANGGDIPVGFRQIFDVDHRRAPSRRKSSRQSVVFFERREYDKSESMLGGCVLI